MMYAISGFVLFNFLVWHFYVEKILVHKDGMISGDLTRMGYLPHLIHLRINSLDLPKKHLEVADYHGEKIDLITLGDSFSNGGAFGANRYYQDYFASRLDWTVLNMEQHPKSKNYMETAILLANSGFLKEHGVKYILIESTVRKTIDRFNSPLKLNFTLSKDEINSFYNFGEVDRSNKAEELPEVHFINNGNFKYVAYSFLYHLSDRAFMSDTHHMRLRKSFFSIGDGKDLLFYHKDIGPIVKQHTRSNIQIINENFNSLAEFLEAKHGVKLIFMPVVTKYDLYTPYIVGNTYPKDLFFEHLRKMPKKYMFIDTKEILSKELQRGVKDIFYCDDTHWSFRASNVISDTLPYLMNENILIKSKE